MTTPCPNCRKELDHHTNEQLQQCALSELSKINRKNITLDTDSTLKSSVETPTGGFVLG